MIATLLVLAQGEGAAPQGGGPLSNPLFPLLLILPLAYFLLIRPMKRQEQERKALIAGMKKNDKVITSGGLIGIVAAIKDKEDEVTLKVDESSNVRLRVLKSSIVRIVHPEEVGKESKEGGA